MANRIKGITIEIGGDTKALDKALADVNKTSRNLQGELRDVERLLKFDPGNAELAAQKQQLLAEQVENTEKKLNQLKDAQQQVEAQFERGDIGADQYRAFQREIADTERKLGSLRDKIDETDDSRAPENAADQLDKIEKEAKEADKAIGKMGSAIGTAAKGIAGMAAAGGAAIGGLIMGTQELSGDLARLRFNASEQGFNVEGVEEGFKTIAAFSGEADSAVETLSNLMQTSFDDAQLAEAIDHINGAAIRFSDTLKTEGIADGLQETFATGAAIGQFGELLERSGVDLEKFNEGLAEAKKNGTETDYVLQQMAELGLAETAEGFRDANAELVAQQEAQMALQTALSDLGVALTPLATTVTEFLTKIAEWGTENVELVKSFDSIAEGITELLPQLFGKGLELITTIVQAIVDNLPMILSTGTEILMTLIRGIIEMLPGLIEQIKTLIPLVSSILKENLPLIIEAGIELLMALLDGIVSLLPDLIQLALDLIVLIATELLKHLPQILESGVEIIFALIDGIISMIPDIVDAIVFDIIPAILKAFTEIQLSDVGEDIIQGLIDGLWKMNDALLKAARNIASGIGSKIAEILQLGSPSKLTMSMGEDTGEGMIIGLKHMVGKVKNMSADLAKAAIPNVPEMDGNAAAGSAAMNRNMTVNINSPKALDVREANRQFNRTLNKMSLMW